MRPLFLAPARPINDEWKIKPYFGVFPEKKKIEFGPKIEMNTYFFMKQVQQ
jgi:hypothetical protein